MKTSQMKNSRGHFRAGLKRTAIVLLIIAITVGWCELTHNTITSEAINLILLKNSPAYKEIELFGERMIINQGRRVNKMEDDFDRAYNHYGVNRGFFCKEYLLTPWVVNLYKKHHTPPPASFDMTDFNSAYEWAYSGSVQKNPGDFYLGNEPWNWEGAVRSYDYSMISKEAAYERLGHVIHMLQDICQPDHFRRIDHPGSSFSTEELDELMKNIRKIRIIPDIVWRAAGVKIPEPVPGAVGFEKLADLYEDARTHELSGLSIRDWKNVGLADGKLFNYFDSAGQGSEYFRSRFGQPALDTALGLHALPVPVNYNIRAASLNTRWIPPLSVKVKIDHVPIIPFIVWDMPSNYPNINGYIKLSGNCTKISVEFSAGLIQLFHDIVRHPPYASKINIYQKNKDGQVLTGLSYEAMWEETDDDRNRKFLKTNAEPGLFQACRQTYIEVTFGPSLSVGELKQATQINPESVRVKVGVRNKSEITVDMVLKEGSDNDGSSPPVFTGSFVPPLSWAGSGDGEKFQGYAKIIAEDIFNHYDYGGRAGANSGKILDALPETKARVTDFKPPYPWADYTPGWDETHNDIGSFVLPPPNIEKCRIYTIGGKEFQQYIGTWDDKGCPFPEFIALDRFGGMLLYDRLAAMEVEIYPEVLKIDQASVSVEIGVNGSLVVYTLNNGIRDFQVQDNGFSLKFQPDLSWKSVEDAVKYGYVRIFLNDNSGHRIDANPATVPVIRSRTDWDYYEEGPDLNHQGHVFIEEKPE